MCGFVVCGAMQAESQRRINAVLTKYAEADERKKIQDEIDAKEKFVRDELEKLKSDEKLANVERIRKMLGTSRDHRVTI